MADRCPDACVGGAALAWRPHAELEAAVLHWVADVAPAPTVAVPWLALVCVAAAVLVAGAIVLIVVLRRR